MLEVAKTLLFSTFADEATVHSTSKVHGIIGGVPVPFPLKDSDGCHGMTPKCPLAKGAEEAYRTSLFVKPIFPSVSYLKHKVILSRLASTVQWLRALPLNIGSLIAVVRASLGTRQMPSSASVGQVVFLEYSVFRPSLINDWLDTREIFLKGP